MLSSALPGLALVVALALAPCRVEALAAHTGCVRAEHADDEVATQAQAIQAARAAFRRRGATEAEREAALDALMGLGAAGAAALLDELAPELGRLRKAHSRLEGRVFTALERGAARVLAERLDRKALAEVEAARRTVLAAAADPNLSKERIQRESDPAYARLEALLTATPNQVFDRDEALFEEWTELLDGLDREVALLARDAAARAALAVDRAGARIAASKRTPAQPPRDAAALLPRAAWVTALATPMSAGDRAALEANEALARDAAAVGLDSEEVRGVAALNRRRVLLGLPAQRLDLRLCEACRSHSKDMVEHGFFAHDSPLPGRETPWKRAAQAGTSASAENIAAGATTGEAAIMQWWYSPGHHRNMLGGGARTGLGRHQNHWTQLFGG